MRNHNTLKNVSPSSFPQALSGNPVWKVFSRAKHGTFFMKQRISGFRCEVSELDSRLKHAGMTRWRERGKTAFVVIQNNRKI